MTYLLVPGLGNAGPSHWLSYWEKALPAERVEFDDWDEPDRADWIAQIDAAIAWAGSETIVIAHSLGCVALMHWARIARPIRGAMLVSTADVDCDAHTPQTCRPFAPMPMERLPFPALVVASTDDPYVGLERSQAFARAWGAEFVNVGAKGHLNSASGLGTWPQGRALLARFLS